MLSRPIVPSGRPQPPDEKPSVVVAEVFGPTFQGEGPSIGQRAAFVRLGGCNLHCSWCDTPYTWDATRYDLRRELTRRPVEHILNQVAPMEPQVNVITGGEPLLWQANDGWAPLVHGLAELAPVEVETNGTIVPTSSLPIRRFNVSPKLPHAGDPPSKRIVPRALAAFATLARADRAVLKVVVKTVADVRRTAKLAHDAGWPTGKTYVMPEASTARRLATTHARIADAALQEGLNMTTRLHVLCWSGERER